MNGSRRHDSKLSCDAISARLGHGRATKRFQDTCCKVPKAEMTLERPITDASAGPPSSTKHRMPLMAAKVLSMAFEGLGRNCLAEYFGITLSSGGADRDGPNAGLPLLAGKIQKAGIRIEGLKSLSEPGAGGQRFTNYCSCPEPA
jgi:hypothetical protein